MSIFFDFEVPSSGRRFRRAVDEDRKDIEAIWDKEKTKGMFPDDTIIGCLIELSTLSICMIDSDNNVLGFAALCDHPAVPGVDPAHWEAWLTSTFQRRFHPRNTLFIQFLCFDDTVKDYFLEEMLHSAFRSDVYLNQVAMVVPQGCPYATISRVMSSKRRPMRWVGATGGDSRLEVAMRLDYCPRLKIRRAVEEDNDDIVNILDKKCPDLREIYGNFYASEIIARHPEANRTVLVGQYQDQAIGVMCLNADVNTECLQSTYDLSVFHGLVKDTPMERELNRRKNTLFKTYGEPIMRGKMSPFDPIPVMTSTHHIGDEIGSPQPLPSRTRTTGRVNFPSKPLQISSPRHSSEESEKSLETLLQFNHMDLSVTQLLEEDPFDYEIVNIDYSLLFIHRVDSAEMHKEEVPKSSSSRKRRRSSIKMEDFGTIYNGAPNAFCIELYGLREDIDEKFSFDLLQAAFECMKDYEYCVIRTPTKDNSFHLLQHFTYVPTRQFLSSEYALYVAHRSSVLEKIHVRPAEVVDITQLARMMHWVEARDALWTVGDAAVGATKHCVPYVLLAENSVVGMAIIEPCDWSAAMRARYGATQWVSEAADRSASAIKCAILYPAFENHYRFFLREMMRLSGSTTLFWLTPYRNKQVAQKANALACAMIPVLPKKSYVSVPIGEKRSKSAPSQTKINMSSSRSRSMMFFSMWLMTKRLSSVPRVNVDTRIVVIGASRTALGFINTLLFDDTASYLTFTNLTLVSPGGATGARHDAAAAMLPRHARDTYRAHRCTPYHYYLDVVQGTMVELNTQNKYIALENGSKVFYDMLFLLFGKQYQYPDYMEDLYKKEKSFQSGEVSYTPVEQADQEETAAAAAATTDPDPPDNVFLVNGPADATRALHYVRRITQSMHHYRIVVYGATLEAYCCMTGLLESGVPPQNITFVEPFPPDDVTKVRVPIFCNIHVDQTVAEALHDLDIEVYRGFYFHEWRCYGCTITHVDFISYHDLLSLDCVAFFYYGKRGINSQAFTALNKSGLAYNNGILTDRRGRTAADGVWAAGTASAYRARCAIHAKHKHYDSYDVGHQLGIYVKNVLDPLFKSQPKRRSRGARRGHVSFDLGAKKGRVPSKEEYEEEVGSEAQSLSELRAPRVLECSLPGELRYLEVRPPARRLPHHYPMTLEFNGFVLETYKRGYFKLHFTPDLIVDGVTCLSKEEHNLGRFAVLYGMSVVTLNNVHYRYSSKQIQDFYEFFNQPWAEFLYHDQLNELFATVKELIPEGKDEGKTLEEALRVVAEHIENKPHDPDYGKYMSCKEKVRNHFERSAHYAAITDHVIEWLAENEDLKNTYLQPRLVTEYTYDIERHPAFRRRKFSINQVFSLI